MNTCTNTGMNTCCTSTRQPSRNKNKNDKVPLTLTDANDLLQIGVCKMHLTPLVFTPQELQNWANDLSQVTPLNAFVEDGEYAFYRNIVDHDTFPFDRIFTSISPVLQKYFGVNVENDDLRLDDAFCIMYDASLHDDTAGSKHMDPSDITVNICLAKSHDVIGSGVMFYGRQKLFDDTGSFHPIPTAISPDCDYACSDNIKNDQSQELEQEQEFVVPQEPGWATIHHGGHWHQTMEMKQGRRTNIVLTFCYTDSNKSGAISRTCYATE